MIQGLLGKEYSRNSIRTHRSAVGVDPLGPRSGGTGPAWDKLGWFGAYQLQTSFALSNYDPGMVKLALIRSLSYQDDVIQAT